MLFLFCRVEALAIPMGLLLFQQKYVINLLNKHNMLDSKPVSTPLVVGTSLTTLDGTVSVNATMYHQVVGGLQHLRMTQPNISFVINKFSQSMHMPSKNH